MEFMQHYEIPRPLSHSQLYVSVSTSKRIEEGAKCPFVLWSCVGGEFQVFGEDYVLVTHCIPALKRPCAHWLHIRMLCTVVHIGS